jgi:hypothetical protein
MSATATSKTIQICLPHGNPRGVRSAAISTNQAVAWLIPRKNLADAREIMALNQTAVYFLFGSEEGSSKLLLYIGQTDNALSRLKQHNVSSEFWDTAIVVTSQTNAFNVLHGTFLEAYCYQKAEEAGRTALKNSQRPTIRAVSDALRPEMLHAFEAIEILLGIFNYPIFESLTSASTPASPDKKLFCRGREYDASGSYEGDVFVVYAGSKIRSSLASSARNGIRNLHQRRQEEGQITENGGYFLVKKDLFFKSPSGAAEFVRGRSSNGWEKWKDAQGKTLSEIIDRNSNL